MSAPYGPPQQPGYGPQPNGPGPAGQGYPGPGMPPSAGQPSAAEPGEPAGGYGAQQPYGQPTANSPYGQPTANPPYGQPAGTQPHGGTNPPTYGPTYPTQQLGQPMPAGATPTPSGGGMSLPVRLAVFGIPLIAIAVILGLVLVNLGGKPTATTTPPEAETVSATPSMTAAPSPSVSSASPVPSSAIPSTTKSSSSAPSGPTTPAIPATVPPVVPGWQTVIGLTDGAAYDIPVNPDWKVEKPDMIRGLETKDGKLVTSRYVSLYKPGACNGKWDRAFTGFTTRQTGGTDEKAVAEKRVRDWADVASTKSDGTKDSLGPVVTEQITTAAGKQAWKSTVEYYPTELGDCQGNLVRISVVTMKNPSINSIVALVFVTDSQLADSLGKETEDKVLASLRIVS